MTLQPASFSSRGYRTRAAVRLSRPRVSADIRHGLDKSVQIQLNPTGDIHPHREWHPPSLEKCHVESTSDATTDQTLNPMGSHIPPGECSLLFMEHAMNVSFSPFDDDDAVIENPKRKPRAPRQTRKEAPKKASAVSQVKSSTPQPKVVLDNLDYLAAGRMISRETGVRKFQAKRAEGVMINLHSPFMKRYFEMQKHFETNNSRKLLRTMTTRMVVCSMGAIGIVIALVPYL